MIAEFVANCPYFPQVKAKHQKPTVYYKKSKFLLGSGKTLYRFCSRFASDSKEI